ncbi:hypothetical protein HanHA89_Chr14g0593001 [Helianthus annuus]|nr:hypothetical protein HanHA89_Chr14g0593001 [Helianthus annuus]
MDKKRKVPSWTSDDDFKDALKKAGLITTENRVKQKPINPKRSLPTRLDTYMHRL